MVAVGQEISSAIDPDADGALLSSYLNFDESDDGHAVITVDANGDGVPDGLQTSITLNDISLDELYAYTGLDDPSEVELIDHLLKNGNLHIDD